MICIAFYNLLRFRCLKPTLLVLALSIFIFGCSTSSEQPDPAPVDPEFVSPEYRALIDEYSDGEADYDGLHNSFQFRATLMNHTVTQAITQKKGQYIQWRKPIKK